MIKVFKIIHFTFLKKINFGSNGAANKINIILNLVRCLKPVPKFHTDKKVTIIAIVMPAIPK